MTEQREGELTGAGGLRIFWRAWFPDGPPRALVALAHGAGEHSGRYGHVADRLVREGYAVYALDHRGHGRSDGPRALVDRMENAVADLNSLIVQANREHPAQPLFLLGHSMGGAVSLCYSVAHQDRLAGLILSAPLAALEAASPATRLVARMMSALTPRVGVFSVDATLVSRDPEVVKAYETDPLVHHGKLPARTVAELARAVESFPDTVEEIKVRTLIIYGGGDRLVPTRGSVMLAERIGAEDLTVKAYAALYHEVLNEPEQDRVLDDVCSWLDERAGSAAAA